MLNRVPLISAFIIIYHTNRLKFYIGSFHDLKVIRCTWGSSSGISTKLQTSSVNLHRGCWKLFAEQTPQREEQIDALELSLLAIHHRQHAIHALFMSDYTCASALALSHSLLFSRTLYHVFFFFFFFLSFFIFLQSQL